MNELQKGLLSKLTNPVAEIKKETKELTQAEKDYQNDYDFTRKKLRDLIAKGDEAMEELLAVALETKDPSVFRVLKEMLEAMGALSSGVIDAAKQKAEIDNVVNGGTPKIGTQNNAIFVGTPDELLEIIRKEDEKELEVIDVTPNDTTTTT